MTISTGAVIDVFGTQDTVTSSSSSVADGAFSVAADVVGWTNDDDAPMASVILEATFSVAPDANSRVTLFARPLNIDGANHGDAPDANYEHVVLGSWPLKNVTSAQRSMMDVALPNGKSGQEYEFYIQNSAGQTLPAGWQLLVTPKTIGAHA